MPKHRLRYKNDAPFTEDMAQELYECARISAELDLRMEALKKKVDPPDTVATLLPQNMAAHV